MTEKLADACRALIRAYDSGTPRAAADALGALRSALAEFDANAEARRKRDAVANCPQHEWLRGPMGVYVCRNCPGVRPA